jgi:hypothetical protein
MALASSLTLADFAAANHTFAATSVAADGTTRIDTASTLTEPQLLIIKSSTTGKAPNQIDRHLIQASLTKKDSLGVPQTVTCNLTLAVPRNVVITRTMVNDQFKYIVNFLATTTNVDAILRNES